MRLLKEIAKATGQVAMIALAAICMSVQFFMSELPTSWNWIIEIAIFSTIIGVIVFINMTDDSEGGAA